VLLLLHVVVSTESHACESLIDCAYNKRVTPVTQAAAYTHTGHTVCVCVTHTLVTHTHTHTHTQTSLFIVLFTRCYLLYSQVIIVPIGAIDYFARLPDEQALCIFFAASTPGSRSRTEAVTCLPTLQHGFELFMLQSATGRCWRYHRGIAA
jgi:hypothetical protein